MVKKRKGISIVEIVVALLIISLISLISIPMLANYQKTSKLKNEARLLATNLRLAQQLAITEQNIYYVAFDFFSESYQIINSKDSKIIKAIKFDSEVKIEEISGFTDNKIQFNSTGGVMETGHISLSNSKNDISTLQIRPSGYVEIID